MVDGVLRIEQAADAAVEYGMPALAITDANNLFGLIKFYKETRKKGVKAIVGAEIGVMRDQSRTAPYHVLLLAQSRLGYLHLCELLTLAYQQQKEHHGQVGVDKETLFTYGEGLIVLSGAHSSDIGDALVQGNYTLAEQLADEWKQHFPDRLYLEVQRYRGAEHADEEEGLVSACVALANKMDLPVVATHPIQFLKEGDFIAHEARVCIAEGHTLSDARRPHHFTEQQYFRSSQEMAEKFFDLPEALTNTVELAKRCNVTIELGKPQLPVFPTPDGISVDDYLRAQAQQGLTQKLDELYGDEREREEKKTEYQERLEFELKTIVQMGFSGYFLIVADFIGWAKENEVPVGPGRGSGTGSLVAFCLGITDMDPMRYGLLFERFLNPERVSMPDFDIDFCQEKRDRVIDYVRDKYGADSVSQIATFGTMAAKGVVRDVGRVLDLPYTFCDVISKLIPFSPGNKMTLEEAKKLEPQLAEREKSEVEVRELLKLAGSLEGLVRNIGMHAGGVLIAPGKLTEFCPLYIQPGADAAVSQFDKDDVEAAGLVKFDFLGLATLTVLDWTLKYVRKLDPDATIELKDIPLDDAATYGLLSKGDTAAVFQFESRGMRELLVRAHPSRLEDLIALVALYRPGPMALIPDYIERKHGRQTVEYLDPRMQSVLGETYGIMIYQEQVMRIAQLIGGYSLGSADLLRRAMSKKKAEEMAAHREIFLKGAEKNQVPRETAHQIFDLMERFADYGFNKSHAATYALIAYQTAYLKVHYPAAFMAANLSLVMHDSDKVKLFYDDSAARGLMILPPDINTSTWYFEPVDAQTLRFGLGAIKGTGKQAVDDIANVRNQDGAFRDLFDLCQRVDRQHMNRRVAEALIRGGALDVLEKNRASLLASAPLAMEAADQASANAGQSALFSEEALPTQALLAEVAPWSDAERLAQEKSVLGFYLSGHPYHQYREELSTLVAASLSSLKPKQEHVLIAGIVTSLRVQSSRRGKMAFVTLDDDQGAVEMMVYNEAFDGARALLQEDRLVIAEVRIAVRHQSEEEQSLRIITDKLYDIDTIRRIKAKRLRIACNATASPKKLLEVLRRFSATDKEEPAVPVIIDYRNEVAEGVILMNDTWRVCPQEKLLHGLKALPGIENARVIY